MALSRALPSGLLLLAIALAQGLFVSGILPVIEKSAPAHAAWIYALYFAGLLIGQLLIVRFGGLSAHRLAYPTYVGLFGVSVMLMGAGVAASPYSLVAGRALEGLAAGLALPVGFSLIVGLPAFGDMRKRISIFNSLFALGFVAGPPLVAALLTQRSPSAILMAAGAAFLAMAATAALVLRPASVTSSEPAVEHEPLDWFDGFYGLFLAKSFYGLFLPYMATHLIHAFRPLSIGEAMVGFAAVFVLGQGVAATVARRFPTDHLRIYLPLALALTLGAVYVGPMPWLMVLAALIHSWLLFIGYMGAATRPTSAREFARINAMSDPGMLLGALLASLGPVGMVGVAALGVVPLMRALRTPAQRMRAEHYHPFVGPIVVRKVLDKHRAPLEVARDWPAEALPALRYDYAADSEGGPTLTLAFGGDWAPMPEAVTLSPALRAHLLRHDLRVVNLEGGRTATGYDERLGGVLFDIPEAHFNRLLWDEAAPGRSDPAFNVLCCVNNHALDAGPAALDATVANVRAAGGLVPVTAELEILEVRGVKVGIFACAFGSNMLWRRNPRLRVVKPEQIVNDAKVREALLADIRHYRAQVDVLVMSYHWGYESEFWPAAIQRDCWAHLRTAGVDILHGHHSHIVQPFEVAPDGLCLYSCGNFAMNMPLEVYRQGAVFSVTLEQTGDRWALRRVETQFTQREGAVIDVLPAQDAVVHRHWAAGAGAVPLVRLA